MTTFVETIYFILVLFFGLHLLICAHELGHYWVARIFNLAIPRFVVGLGPQLVSGTRGETSFQWRLIPIAGFVQLLGVTGPDDPQIVRIKALDDEFLGYKNNRLAEDEAADVSFINEAVERRRPLRDPNRHYYSLTWWRQVAVMLAGPAMNIIMMLVLPAASMVIEAAKPTQFELHAIALFSSRKHPGVIEMFDILFIRTRTNQNPATLSLETVSQVHRYRRRVGTYLPLNARTIAALNEGYLQKQGTPISVCRDHAFNPMFNSAGFGLTDCLPGIDSVIGKEKLTVSSRWLQGGVHSSLLMLALTSWGMAIINLCPIPPLDGGRIVFSLLKGVGLPLPEKVVLRLSLLGLTLIALYQVISWVQVAIQWLAPG